MSGPRSLQKILVAFAVFGMVAQPASADITVFLDFTTDNHDGNGGAANSVADWIDEVNQAATDAGKAAWTSTERAQIEANIIADLNTIYQDYQVTFTTTDPVPEHETIYFGVESGALGFAPLDIGNQFSSELGITNVAPATFDFIIDESLSRADQITQLSAAIAGTAAHELGHSVGLLHHHTYSSEGIDPSTYSDTMGLQNQHILATGSTGLGETGRETLRDFSPFEKVMLDISGGSTLIFGGQDNNSLVMNPVMSDATENGSFNTLGTDAANTLAAAMGSTAVTQTEGETSGLDIAFIEADLDTATGDIDIFKLTLDAPGTLMAQMYSDFLVYGGGAEFDGQLRLLDSAGTVLATNDDVRYDGNTYDSGTLRSLDPFLNNIQIAAAGDYFLEVSGVAGEELGSNYWLVSAFSAVPEPSSVAFVLLGMTGLINRRKRRDEAAA